MSEFSNEETKKGKGEYPLHLLGVALAHGLFTDSHFQVVQASQGTDGERSLVIIKADPRINDFLEQMTKKPGLSLLSGLTGLKEEELTSVFLEQSAQQVYEGGESDFYYAREGTLRDEIENRITAWFSERGKDHVYLQLPFPSFYFLTHMPEFLSLGDSKILQELKRNGEAYGINKWNFQENLIHLLRSGLLVPDPEKQSIRPATPNELNSYTLLRDTSIITLHRNAFQRAGVYFVEPLTKLPDNYLRVQGVGPAGISALPPRNEDCQRFVNDFFRLVYSL